MRLSNAVGSEAGQEVQTETRSISERMKKEASFELNICGALRSMCAQAPDAV